MRSCNQPIACIQVHCSLRSKPPFLNTLLMNWWSCSIRITCQHRKSEANLREIMDRKRLAATYVGASHYTTKAQI